YCTAGGMGGNADFTAPTGNARSGTQPLSNTMPELSPANSLRDTSSRLSPSEQIRPSALR
ncbi:hypothetical protein ALP03_03838, partial [Pseudomonas amygdali pv. tabaci]